MTFREAEGLGAYFGDDISSCCRDRFFPRLRAVADLEPDSVPPGTLVRGPHERRRRHRGAMRRRLSASANGRRLSASSRVSEPGGRINAGRDGLVRSVLVSAPGAFGWYGRLRSVGRCVRLSASSRRAIWPFHTWSRFLSTRLPGAKAMELRSGRSIRSKSSQTSQPSQLSSSS